MKIAVNTRFLLHNKLEGIGWFTFETIKRIVEKHPEHTFHFIFDRPYHPLFIFGRNVVPHVIPPPARHPYLWYAWFEFSLPYTLSRIKPDIFISPDGYTSLRSKVPDLVVLHDLAFVHNPMYVSPLVNRYYNYFVPRYLNKARRLATVSEFSKQDIIKQYGIAAEKIDVLCNGAHSDFRPLEEGERKKVKQEFAAGNPYFIFVGAIHPRKNVPALLRAFDLLKSKYGLPHKLLLVGRRAWDNAEMDAVLAAMTYKNDVVFINYADRSLLSRLTAAAEAMVYTSLFEGFGIPIMEAFQCKTPVITSNLSSMAEVGADAALLVDPNSIGDIADAMHKIATEKELCDGLIERGWQRKNRYTWDIAADGLWQSALKTLQL